MDLSMLSLMPAKADIVVCGPEASGTRALAINLYRLCQPVGKTVRHLSLPNGEWWWTAEDIAGEIPVVITRRPDLQCIAAWKSGCTETLGEAKSEWPRAVAMLATLPDALWLLYEAVAAAPEVQFRRVCAQLRIPFDERVLEMGDGWWPWRDENVKYQT